MTPLLANDFLHLPHYCVIIFRNSSRSSSQNYHTSLQSMSFCVPSILRPSPPLWLEEICQKLQDNDTSLSTLDLSHPRIDDRLAQIVARALAENQVVSTVILSCFAIVDDGAHVLGKALMEHTLLSKLQLRDLRDQREINIFFDLLAKHGNIEEISLRHSRICMRSVKSIVRFLNKHPRLRELRIVDCQIDEASERELFQQGIKGHPSLKCVYLINLGISPETTLSLANMLQEGCIEELHVCENDLQDEGTLALAASLAQNKTLRLLDLRSNGISDQAALSLQGMLVSGTRLSTLLLSDNCIGDLGITALSRGLCHANCHLRILDLSQNSIGIKGALSLSKTLRSNGQLLELNISLNPIGDQGATYLIAALVKNRTLQSLRMRRCGINDHGAQEISQYLPRMHGLKELVLDKNSITPLGSVAIAAGMRENVVIEYLHMGNKVNSISREILHYTRLNKAGRRIFLHANTVHPSLWPRVYSRLSSDLDMLNYFIKQKPDMTDSYAAIHASLQPKKRKHP